VPPGHRAFKSQQHRWAKGSVQVFGSSGGDPRLARAVAREARGGRAPLRKHRLPRSCCCSRCCCRSRCALPTRVPAWMHPIVFTLCTLSVLAFYDRSQKAVGRPLFTRLKDTLIATLLGIGMCVSQTRAGARRSAPRHRRLRPHAEARGFDHDAPLPHGVGRASPASSSRSPPGSRGGSTPPPTAGSGDRSPSCSLLRELRLGRLALRAPLGARLIRRGRRSPPREPSVVRAGSAETFRVRPVCF
jgi:hypothetical protein